METDRFDRATRPVATVLSRRALAGAMGLAALTLPGLVEARKRKHNKKRKKKRKETHKQTCGKAGSQPAKGKCCAGSVLVDGTCQRCDVCASGCEFSSVQAAIDAAAPGATIAICPGAYREDLTINGVLTLVGAGDGEGSGDTIVQGTGQNSVVTIGGGIVALERLRLAGGGGNPTEFFSGGGIYNEGTTKVIGCTVSGNTADYGGGIFHSAGALTLTDCRVSGNEAGTEGGGIYILDPTEATLEMIGCKVSGNTAVDAGGGIYNQGTLRLTDSEISGNSTYNGGGIHSSGTVTVDAASRVTGNTAIVGGGGIYTSGTVTLASSANVTGNTPSNCAGTAVPQCSG
jgi:predicted outer membrane repeat protein